MSNIKVSIVCNTYNQETYIGDAIESFLMQKTNFDYEILVHDDASTDQTAEIVRQYAARFPEKVKPILQEENQTVKRVKITLSIQIPRAEGKYIAMCEGDDYWTDVYKLQKQYDYMEAHPDCYFCAHNASDVQAEEKKVLQTTGYSVGTLSANREEYGMLDAIRGFGRWTATCSFMFRKSAFADIPKFAFTAPCGDYVWPIICAEQGYLSYLPDNMAAHRVRAKNSWTATCAKNPNKLLTYYTRYEAMLEELNEYTHEEYSQEIENEKTRIWFKYYTAIKDKKALQSDRFKNHFKKLSFKQRLILWSKLNFPLLEKLVHRIKKITV